MELEDIEELKSSGICRKGSNPFTRIVIANKVSSEGQGAEMNVVTKESWQVYIATILPDEVSKLSDRQEGFCYLQLNIEKLNIVFIGSDTKETCK